MIEHLHNNPDRHFYINNQSEDEAKLLLAELGMTGSFPEQGSGDPGRDQIAIGECSTHYISAILFATDPNPAKNGYLIFALPKRQTSPNQMRAILRGMVADFEIRDFEVTDTMFS